MSNSDLTHDSRPRIFLAFLIVFGSALQAGQTLIWSLTEPSIDVPVAPILKVDPNTAPIEVLLALPRLGPTLAERIEKERESQPFRSIDDLDDRVRGIGPATRRAIEPYLTFGSAPTR